MCLRSRVLALTILLGACSSGGDDSKGGTGGISATGGSSGMGGASSTGGKTGTGSTTGTGGKTATGGQGGTATGGVVAATGGSGGRATGGSPGTGGAVTATGGAAATHDHCVDGFSPDPADETMKDGPADYVKNNQTDSTVQPEVIAWFQAHVWESAHFQWHNIRRCKTGGVMTNRDGNLNPCTHTDLVPAAQEGSGADDGLQFLAMHRHMIQSLKQLFPKHTEQFDGWSAFPTTKSQMPPQWAADWTPFPAKDAMNGAKSDDPMSHLTEMGFATEGDFGQWIQTTSGLHGALHFKWVRTNNDDHGLGNQFVNIDNYMFWKLHGWIDKAWDKYRAAKGKKPTDPDIQAAVLAQCRQMDELAKLVKPGLNTDPGTCTAPPPKETGDFVTKIRPIFESATNKCTGCHGTGAMAGLTLGGNQCLKSSDIAKSIVGKASVTGGQLKLIEPGNADKSWLYRKVAGTAGAAGCVKTGNVDCTTDTMPQGGGVTLSQTELDALKAWINAGAVIPQ